MTNCLANWRANLMGVRSRALLLVGGLLLLATSCQYVPVVNSGGFQPREVEVLLGLDTRSTSSVYADEGNSESVRVRYYIVPESFSEIDEEYSSLLEAAGYEVDRLGKKGDDSWAELSALGSYSIRIGPYSAFESSPSHLRGREGVRQAFLAGSHRRGDAVTIVAVSDFVG